MTSVDPVLPELSEHDPRLCPNNEYADNILTYGPQAVWIGKPPYEGPHRWHGGGSLGSVTYERYCAQCEVRESAVRARFSDWRYEQLVAGLTDAVKALTTAIEGKNW